MTDRDRLTQLAKAFHEEYERLAPEFGYSTRKATRVPWPPSNAHLMIATVKAAVEREGWVRGVVTDGCVVTNEFLERLGWVRLADADIDAGVEIYRRIFPRHLYASARQIVEGVLAAVFGREADSE